jgi:hypothetical protein
MHYFGQHHFLTRAQWTVTFRCFMVVVYRHNRQCCLHWVCTQTVLDMDQRHMDQEHRSLCVVKQKKVIVRSGPLSVEALFLGRDIGQLGQGCPSHPDPHVYRGPCKKNQLRPRFFSQLVSRGCGRVR